MSGTRLQVDFFFKDKTPKQVNEDFPQLLDMLKVAKAKAYRAGDKIELKASYHVCFHDETTNKPCEPEIEI